MSMIGFITRSVRISRIIGFRASVRAGLALLLLHARRLFLPFDDGRARTAPKDMTLVPHDPPAAFALQADRQTIANALNRILRDLDRR